MLPVHAPCCLCTHLAACARTLLPVHAPCCLRTQVLSCALFGRSDVDCNNVFNVKDDSPRKIVPSLPEHELPM
jgi:hypothetical protein